MQLLVGVVIFGEQLAAGEVVGFVVVWIALGIFGWDQYTVTRRFVPEAAV